MDHITKSKEKIEINQDIITSKPFIPYNQEILEIPQNLSKGTNYGISIMQSNNDTVGEKINKLQTTLNNVIEILSFLTIRQLPGILDNLTTKIENIQIPRIEIPSSSTQNLKMLSIIEQLSKEIDTPEEEKEIVINKIKEILLKQEILTINPPLNIT